MDTGLEGPAFSDEVGETNAGATLGDWGGVPAPNVSLIQNYINYNYRKV